ncbi:MAG: hypothetical protein CME65_11970 [Halobacteriovoraceae bacterium]|nr:hypothetical protein [Halobacteriovoraceae bacterium]|tara:strand:+ start:2257 stop:2874 length:618 start_codon:yes stop_codon:yes gene_type:complete
MREKVLGLLAYLIIKIIGVTLRVHSHFPDEKTKNDYLERFNNKKPRPGQNYLLAFFHQDELCLLNHWRHRNMSVLVSISKDGEIMSNAAKLLGYQPVRGSSSKKAVSGLIAAIKKVRSGASMAFAVDGPRGPIYKVKDGVCAVSKKTNTPIMPVRASSSRTKVFEKSWNKAKFPYPFSRIDLYFGELKVYEKSELEDQLINLLPL